MFNVISWSVKLKTNVHIPKVKVTLLGQRCEKKHGSIKENAIFGYSENSLDVFVWSITELFVNEMSIHIQDHGIDCQVQNPGCFLKGQCHLEVKGQNWLQLSLP